MIQGWPRMSAGEGCISGRVDLGSAAGLGPMQHSNLYSAVMTSTYPLQDPPTVLNEANSQVRGVQDLGTFFELPNKQAITSLQGRLFSATNCCLLCHLKRGRENLRGLHQQCSNEVTADSAVRGDVS